MTFTATVLQKNGTWFLPRLTQVIGVHQETVDSYLTNIIAGAIEATAEEQARREVEEMAAKINQVAHDIESSYVAPKLFLFYF